jgi:hypothetical protein
MNVGFPNSIIMAGMPSPTLSITLWTQMSISKLVKMAFLVNRLLPKGGQFCFGTLFQKRMSNLRQIMYVSFMFHAVKGHIVNLYLLNAC